MMGAGVLSLAPLSDFPMGFQSVVEEVANGDHTEEDQRIESFHARVTPPVGKGSTMHDKLRAWWWHRQGFTEKLHGQSCGAVVDRGGWIRSVGGSTPYLTFFSRAEIGREKVDRAVRDLQIHELPAARGCTYVVPASDFGLALACARGHDAEMKSAVKHLGVTEQEIAKLEERVLEVLTAPLDPRQLKDVLGDAVRNLGEPGKKKGMTTTLPLALGRLQARGEIRRVPVNGRLDQQRYAYTRWEHPPTCPLPPEEVLLELGRRYFRWAGPATPEAFAAFAACPKTAARLVALELGLKESEEGCWLPEDLEEYASFRAPHEPQYALVGALDNLSLLRRDLAALADELPPIVSSSLGEMHHQAIFDRGRLIGLWDYDFEAGKIVWKTFEKADVKKTLQQTEEFIQTQLGDVRSMSLDSPQSRKKRLADLGV